MVGLIRRWRRARLLKQPFPTEWEEILRTRVPWFPVLSEGEQRRLRQHAMIFLHEKYFIPAQDMEITEEVRVVIAAGAVRLLLGLDISLYDHLTEVVVYPCDFKVPYAEGPTLGEALPFGTVVLSWPSVRRGVDRPGIHEDVLTHEFAHVLDRQETFVEGDFEGTPEEDIGRWSKGFLHHYEALRRGRRAYAQLLDDYGGESPSEFFAVATETFFAKPQRLRRQLPDLYDELAAFYRQDPATVTSP
ncbi:MAG: M90 family metallopeptidase [Pseudomonadota bacterium]